MLIHFLKELPGIFTERQCNQVAPAPPVVEAWGQCFLILPRTQDLSEEEKEEHSWSPLVKEHQGGWALTGLEGMALL